MKKRILAAALSAAVLAFPAPQSGAAEYRIDPAHSVVQFKISCDQARLVEGDWGMR